MVYCAATGSQYQVYMKWCLPAAANFFSPIASVGLTPIVTLASTSFANSTFSLLTMVVVRSLRGNQLQTGEEIENSLPDYDTQGLFGRICPLFRSLIPSNPTLAPTRPCFIMPLNTKISFARTNLAAVDSTKLVLDFAGHQRC